MKKFSLIKIFIVIFFTTNMIQSARHTEIYQNKEDIYINLKRFQNNQISILNDEIIKRLNYGIPVKINFTIELLSSGIIYDETLVTKKISKTVSYDRWSDYYLLKSEQRVISKQKKISDLEQEIFNLSQFAIYPKSEVDSQKKYYFDVKISIINQDLPFYFQLLENLFLVMKNDVHQYQSQPYLGEEILNL